MTKIYKCDKCGKIFNLKGNYDQHLKRKKPCAEISNIQQEISNIQQDLQDEEPTGLMQCISCKKTPKEFFRQMTSFSADFQTSFLKRFLRAIFIFWK